MQEKPSKACFRTTRGVDAADAVHSCFFSEGGFRDVLYKYHLYAVKLFLSLTYGFDLWYNKSYNG